MIGDGVLSSAMDLWYIVVSRPMIQMIHELMVYSSITTNDPNDPDHLDHSPHRQHT